MKLTNTLREAFVKAVMADVPATDYNDLARKTAQDDLCAQMPSKVFALYQDTKLRDYLKNGFWHGAPGSLSGLCLYGWGRLVPTETCMVELRRLADLKSRQDSERAKLRAPIAAAAMAATTTNRLVELLPELVRYLPVDATPSRALPVVTNVVSNLRAAGWPAGKTAA
jgi:hypothetical protein